MAKDIRAIEKFQKDNPQAQLDPKTAAQMVAYSKALNDILQEEELWARKMLAEASKLSVSELMKRAQQDNAGQQSEEADGEED